MTFDEIKQRYIEGAPLDETLERLAGTGREPVLECAGGEWIVWFGDEANLRPTIREAMMAAFDAE